MRALFGLAPVGLRNVRYRTLFFWLYAEPNALNPRLDGRVDQMLQVRALPRAESWLAQPRYLAGTIGRSGAIETIQVIR